MESACIKIYVVCHKPAYVPESPLLLPIQVGTQQSSKALPGMLRDDTGDNISVRNPRYCELTAQYWAWKNDTADYYGFFHYRRYLSFNPEIMPEDGWGNIARRSLTPQVIEELHLNEAEMRALITRYDVITLRARDINDIPGGARDPKVTNYTEYGSNLFQNQKDLDLTLDILLQKYPQFEQAVKRYMADSHAYECNMFIMSRAQYQKYCAWLFDILFAAEEKIDFSEYNRQENRVMGFLAERLFGIYYTWLKEDPSVRRHELQKTLFEQTAPPVRIEPLEIKDTPLDTIPIVLAANDRFAPYLATMTASVIAHASASHFYDLIILHRDISAENQEMIKELTAGKEENISIRFANVQAYFDHLELFIDQHLSIETYYRLVIPDIMPAYDKILYLDADMVVERDVAELYQIDLGKTAIAGVKDIDIAGQAKQNMDLVSYLTEVIGLKSPFDYFQAGVLIISLNELRKLASVKELLATAQARSWKCHDQDVLNHICRGSVTYLPQNWNVLMNWQEGGRSRMQVLQCAPEMTFSLYLEARKNPYVVHFAGYQKPWNLPICDMAPHFWKYAKMTPYYESMLFSKTAHSETDIYINGVKEPIYANGVVVKLISILNRTLPIGSKRRDVVRKVVRVFIH